MYTTTRHETLTQLVRETGCTLYEATMAFDRCHGDYMATKAFLARLAPTPERRASIIPPSSEVLAMMYPASSRTPSDVRLRRVIVERRTGKSSTLCRNTLMMHDYNVGAAIDFLGGHAAA